MKLVHWLTSLALLTASFDILLAVNVVGTLRFAQIMLAALIVLAIAQVYQRKTLLWPRGGYALALWCILQGLLLTQSTAPVVSAELYCLLVFTIISVYAVLQLYGRSRLMPSLMRMYLLSYVLISVFGAIQFVSPALHLGQPLIQQWIVHGLIPRINGFSYEPSYFATYLIMGWIMLIDLRASKAEITQSRSWFWFMILVSLVLFFSTSKTAWLLMIFEVLARLAPGVFRLLRRQWTRLSSGRLVLVLPRFYVILWLGVGSAAMFSFLLVLNRFVDLNQFLQGTGLNGTAAHSVNDRVGGFYLTLTVIQQHFWIGRSLGGVAGEVAALHGQSVRTIGELRLFWGYPVPLDVFAASGFFGFIPFAYFFWAITRGERKLLRENSDDERAKWLHALIRAFLFEWLALCADQNLLRVYLWLHITMMVVVGYNLRYHKEGRVPSQVLSAA